MNASERTLYSSPKVWYAGDHETVHYFYDGKVVAGNELLVMASELPIGAYALMGTDFWFRKTSYDRDVPWVCIHPTDVPAAVKALAILIPKE